MALQKYRSDYAEKPEKNGSIAWYARWLGGPSLAKIENCPTPHGPRTVYITAEPDTFFSIPAACSFKKKTVRGFLTHSEDGWTFHANQF